MRVPPYLPFMDGPPDFAPKLSPISEERWLLPDTEAAGWIEEKREIMVHLREETFAAIRGSEAARCEASRLIFAHLKQDNAFRMPTELEDAAAHLSDDLCIIQQSEAGEWCLTAASLCAPTYWRLRENIGKPLAGLHAPVPGGDPGLAVRIGRIFSAMRPDQIFERCNWTIQAGGERFTPDSAPLKLAAANMPEGSALSELHLRVERQTVRKLPQTGAILFTIRICVDPLEAVVKVPGARQALSRAWDSAPEQVARYKGWAAYDQLVKFALSEWKTGEANGQDSAKNDDCRD